MLFNAEIAEISAEKTKNDEAAGRRSIHALTRLERRASGERGGKILLIPAFLSTLFCVLCAYLCDLCVSALNTMPVWLRLRRVRKWFRQERVNTSAHGGVFPSD